MAATVAARRAPFSFYDPALRPAAEAPKKRADNRPPEPTPEVAAYNRSCLDQEATLQAALVTFMPRFARLQREYIDVVSGDKVVSAASKNLAESDGAKRLAHIRYLLDNMGFKRTIMQVQLHEQMICALLRQIWGAEYDQKTETINAMHKIVREFMDVVIQTGRRMGKSYGVALFCAALLVARTRPQPGAARRASAARSSRRRCRRRARRCGRPVGRIASSDAPRWPAARHPPSAR